MEYNLKDKIVVDETFISDLIAKNWQEVESLQQQAANIDTSTKLGAEIEKLLKNTCTNYYVLIGCLENLADGAEVTSVEVPAEAVEPEVKSDPQPESDFEFGEAKILVDSDDLYRVPEEDFEPFEYFVDFEDPVGDPLTDKDLYNN